MKARFAVITRFGQQNVGRFNTLREAKDFGRALNVDFTVWDYGCAWTSFRSWD
jgi:hypothetical protein